MTIPYLGQFHVLLSLKSVICWRKPLTILQWNITFQFLKILHMLHLPRIKFRNYVLIALISKFCAIGCVKMWYEFDTLTKLFLNAPFIFYYKKLKCSHLYAITNNSVHFIFATPSTHPLHTLVLQRPVLTSTTASHLVTSLQTQCLWLSSISRQLDQIPDPSPFGF